MTIVRKNILIVINDHQTRVRLRSIFENLGHYVVSTGTAADAINLIQNITLPNLIISGGNFPILSVSDFVKILQAKDEFKHIPICLLKSHKGLLEGTCYSLDLEDPNSALEALNHCT